MDIEQRARNFLEQHYCVLYIKKRGKDNGVWEVEATVSAFGEKAIRLRIDDTSGKIINWQLENKPTSSSKTKE